VAAKGWNRYRNGSMSLEMPPQGVKTSKGLAMLSMQMAGTILNSDSATLAAIAAAKGGASTKKQVSKLEKPDRLVDVSFISGKDELSTENIGAMLPGKAKPQEVVVMTAHYDHLGIMNGQVYNGADDDGSGTSNVLEMARLFAEAAREGHTPTRSVAFLLFTGEEKGLLGSEYYSRNPAFPMEKTSADLNTDMIGRIDDKQPAGEVYTYMIGSDKISKSLDKLVKETNRQCCNIKLDYTYNDENHPQQYYYRSDHYNFAKKGVPVAFFFTGEHPDYHEPIDDIDKILLPRVTAIGRYIFLTAWGIAQRPTILERVK
jgi:Zn-dependent M28 family amino/carboxypeptidase